MHWLESWGTPATPEVAAACERELAAEVAPGHLLHGIPLTTLGKHDGSDDVLFQLLDGSHRVAVVHLTWARHPEPPPWPWCEVFADLESFAANRMLGDAEEL